MPNRSLYANLFALLLISLFFIQCSKKNKPSPEGSATNTETIIQTDTIIRVDTVQQIVEMPHVWLEKMNVLYVGVDNPLSVPPGSEISSAGPVNLTETGAGKFNARVSMPGEVRLMVTKDGQTASFTLRAKRIPDPVARVGNSSGGDIANGEFKAQGGVGAYLDNFDFDASCAIVGFNLVYVPRRQDPLSTNNSGARYTDAARRLVNQAKPGDMYFYENVRAKCPGDATSRKVNTLVFKIR